MKASDIERFWRKVDKSGDCWIWLAGKDRKGYGKFSLGGKYDANGNRRNTMVSAHRISYELAHGAIPEHDDFHGMCVLHRCDNPGCVNPDHLFLGTNEDNVHDMLTKGRNATNPNLGSAHAMAILNESQVRELHSRYQSGGITQAELATEYGVSLSTINHIMTGRLWSHLGLARKKAKAP